MGYLGHTCEEGNSSTDDAVDRVRLLPEFKAWADAAQVSPSEWMTAILAAADLAPNENSCSQAVVHAELALRVARAKEVVNGAFANALDDIGQVKAAALQRATPEVAAALEAEGRSAAVNKHRFEGNPRYEVPMASLRAAMESLENS